MLLSSAKCVCIFRFDPFTYFNIERFVDLICVLLYLYQRIKREEKNKDAADSIHTFSSLCWNCECDLQMIAIKWWIAQKIIEIECMD